MVTVTSPGRGATAMMDDVGEPLEQAVNAVPGLAHLRTVATADRVTVTVELRRDAEVERARAAVRDAVTAAMRRLPSDVDVPMVSVALPPRRPQLLVAPLEDAWALSSSGLRYQIDRCGQEEELAVILDATRLRAVGLRGDEVVTVLRRGTQTAPAGRVDPVPAGGLRLAYDGLDALRTIELADGVRLADVAELRREPARGCRAIVDGEPVALMTAVARAGAGRPSAPLQLLDGRRVHGAFAPARDATVVVPVVTAMPGARWLAVRADSATGEVQVDVGVASADATKAVTAAITAQLERQGLVGGRWTGAGAAARPTIVTGAAASAPCDPRTAWPCDRVTTRALTIDRARVASFGVDPADVVAALQLQLGGVVVSEIGTDDDLLAVRVRFAADTPLEQILVPSEDLGLLGLDRMTTVEDRDEPRALLRINRQAAIERWP